MPPRRNLRLGSTQGSLHLPQTKKSVFKSVGFGKQKSQIHNEDKLFFEGNDEQLPLQEVKEGLLLPHIVLFFLRNKGRNEPEKDEESSVFDRLMLQHTAIANIGIVHVAGGRGQEGFHDNREQNIIFSQTVRD